MAKNTQKKSAKKNVNLGVSEAKKPIMKPTPKTEKKPRNKPFILAVALCVLGVAAWKIYPLYTENAVNTQKMKNNTKQAIHRKPSAAPEKTTTSPQGIFTRPTKALDTTHTPSSETTSVVSKNTHEMPSHQPQIVDITTAITGETSAETLQAQHVTARAVQATLALAGTEASSAKNPSVKNTVTPRQKITVEVPKTPKSVQQALQAMRILTQPTFDAVMALEPSMQHAPKTVRETYTAYRQTWQAKNKHEHLAPTEKPAIWQKMLGKVMIIEKRSEKNRSEAKTSLPQQKEAFQNALLAWALQAAK